MTDRLNEGTNECWMPAQSREDAFEGVRDSETYSICFEEKCILNQLLDIWCQVHLMGSVGAGRCLCPVAKGCGNTLSHAIDSVC